MIAMPLGCTRCSSAGLPYKDDSPVDGCGYRVPDPGEDLDRICAEVNRPLFIIALQASISWHTSHRTATRSLGIAAAILVTSLIICCISAGRSSGLSGGTMLL